MHYRPRVKEIPPIENGGARILTRDPERYLVNGDQLLAQAAEADDEPSATRRCERAARSYVAAIDVANARGGEDITPLAYTEASTKAAALGLALASNRDLKPEQKQQLIDEVIETAEAALSEARETLLHEDETGITDVLPVVIIEAELAALKHDDEALLRLEDVPLPEVQDLVAHLKEDPTISLNDVTQALLHSPHHLQEAA